MVNCNPETVSTDYDTSNRLYFEPLGAEEVLEICARELPDGVVIQFGGQTPLKLAREIEAEGWRILGTPFDAVDLAEDRERFAALCDELDIAVPSWAMAEGAEHAVYVAEAIGYPVLVRPSYVLGGRNMQVCYDGQAVAEAAASGERVLVDHFLEGAIEIDVDALCDGRETYVAAVMEHVEEAGIHSGDSSCVLPAPSLDPGDGGRGRGRRAAARSGARRGRSRQRAACGRRRRGLRHRGEPAGVADGALREQGDRHQSRRGRLPARVRHTARRARPPGRSDAEAGLRESRGAAVCALPRRRPGARPGDAVDRRGHGERGRFSDRLCEGRAGGRAAASRRRGRPSSRCATRTSRRRSRSRARSRSSGSASSRPPGRHVRSRPRGSPSSTCARWRRAATARPSSTSSAGAIATSCVNTPFGDSGARSDGYLIREAALAARIPCITTIAGARAAVHAIADAQGDLTVSLQEQISAQKRSA